MPRTALAICLAVALTNLGVSAAVRAEPPQQALQTFLADAAAAQSRGDFSSAAESYRKATEVDPAVPELWANLGLMEYQIGKSADAVQSFKRAIHLNPSLFVPQLFLGIEYLSAKNPLAALPHLETAEKLNPRDLQTALSLGSAYAKLGRSEAATAAYIRATEISPTNGNTWLDLGTSYLQQVENDARVMSSTYRNSPYVKLRAAETLADEGSLNAAEKWYKEATASASPLPCAHAGFGITLLRLKKASEAERQFDLEEKTGSHCGLAPLGMAVSAVAQGHPEIGVKALTALSAADRNFVLSTLPLFQGALDSEEVRSLADLAREQHNPENHSADLGFIIESALTAGGSSAPTPPGESSVYPAPQASAPGKAAQLYASGRYTQCDYSLRRASATLAGSQQRLLAACSFYAGDFATVSKAAARLKANSETRVEGLYWESKADEKLAVAALARAGEIDPDSSRMHVLLGDIFRQKRHWSEAESEYRKAINLDPKSRAARLSLAIVLFTEMKADEAFNLDKALLNEVPDEPEANLLAADILAQKHEFAQAEPFLARCKDLKVDLVPRYHVLLGQVYAATGRISAAISEYQLGLSADQDGSIHYQLSRLYQRIGDKVDAKREIRISQEVRERWDRQAHIDLGQSQVEAMSP